MALSGYCKKQLGNSLLTGIPQIIKSKGILRKILKSVVFFCCVTGCFYQTWSFMQVYWSYPIIVDVFVSSPNEVEIPAFTVCSYNGIRASKFCEIFSNLCTPERSLSEFCMDHIQYCRKEDEAPEGVKVPTIPPQEIPADVTSVGFDDARTFYQYIGTEKDSFINMAYKIEDEEEDIEAEWIGVFNVQGVPTNCFAFNTVWKNSSAKVAKVNTKTEYVIDLHLKTSDNFYQNTPMAIQVAVHSPFTKVNPFKEGFSIKPCTTYKIYLKKTQKQLLPAPYPTNCTDYDDLWRIRGGVGPLSQEMCVDECLLNISLTEHGCFDPIYITYPNTEKFCFGHKPEENDYKVCTDRCQPSCHFESMQVEVEEFIYADSEDELDSKKTSCSTGITFSLMRMEVINYSYKRKYESVELFGYVGGYLGMWLGISLIAVIDFIETCFMIILYGCKKIQRKEKTEKVDYYRPRKLFKIKLTETDSSIPRVHPKKRFVY